MTNETEPLTWILPRIHSCYEIWGTMLYPELFNNSLRHSILLLVWFLALLMLWYKQILGIKTFVWKVILYTLAVF